MFNDYFLNVKKNNLSKRMRKKTIVKKLVYIFMFNYVFFNVNKKYHKQTHKNNI